MTDFGLERTADDSLKRSNTWRRLLTLTIWLLRVSVVCWVGAMAGLGLFGVKLIGEAGDEIVTDAFEDLFEAGVSVYPLIGAFLSLWAAAVLSLVLTLLEARHSGVRATLGPKPTVFAAVALGLIVAPFTWDPGYNFIVSDLRAEIGFWVLLFFLQIAAATILLRITSSYRPPIAHRSARSRLGRSPLLVLAPVVAVVVVSATAFQLRGVPVVEGAWSVGHDPEGLAFDAEAAQRWTSENATEHELSCLTEAGVDEDGLWLIDERFVPWLEENAPPPDLVSELASVVKDCVGAETYTADLVYALAYISRKAYDSQAVADCLVAAFEGPEWVNYWVAGSQDDQDEGNRITGLCHNVASSGLATFVEDTTAKLPPGFLAQPIEGFPHGLETPDGNSRVVAARGWLQEDAMMTFAGSLPDNVSSIDDEGLALMAAGVDTVFADLTTAERAALLTALVGRDNDAVVAGKRVCLVYDVQLFVVNSTMPCTLIPGASG